MRLALTLHLLLKSANLPCQRAQKKQQQSRQHTTELVVAILKGTNFENDHYEDYRSTS